MKTTSQCCGHVVILCREALSTHCIEYLHTIYTLSTHYLHTLQHTIYIYTLSTHYIHTIYTLSTHSPPVDGDQLLVEQVVIVEGLVADGRAWPPPGLKMETLQEECTKLNKVWLAKIFKAARRL